MIKISRVQVLDGDLRQYASTSVSGGGGTVSVVNGVTYGKLDNVTSSTSHHTNQDIWVKNISDGQEFQIQLFGSSFLIRPGHVLTVVYDSITNCWERLINEATGSESYGNGKINPAQVMSYESDGSLKEKVPQCVFLAIPIINLLAGILVLGRLLGFPVNAGGEKIPGVFFDLFISFATGVVVFVLSYVIFLEAKGFFAHLMYFVGIVIASIFHVKASQSPYLKAAGIVARRSDQIDKEVAEFRASFATS